MCSIHHQSLLQMISRGSFCQTQMMEVREVIKKIKIRIRKVEGRTRYYTPDVLKELDEKEFKEELKNLRKDFEDCEDEIVRLITDLEEEEP